MSNMLPVRLLLASVVIVVALATVTCDEPKPELTSAWLFGPDTLKVDTTNEYESCWLDVAPEMLQYNSKKVTFYFDFDHVTGENADFVLFDEVQYGSFVTGSPATPLQQQEDSPSCEMWWSVTAPGKYYAVVQYHGPDSASTKLFGAIHATYWKVK
jgi:hypothetical protein